MNKEILGLAEQIYQLGYEKGQKDPLMLFKTDYDRGLNDAWECARKIVDMDCETVSKIFANSHYDNVFTDCKASDAIKRIRQYEEKQKQPNEFEIGDEVISIYGNKGCVTSFNDDELYVLYRNGTVGHSTKCTYQKTGRQFPFLVAVLNEMKESD